MDWNRAPDSPASVALLLSAPAGKDGFIRNCKVMGFNMIRFGAGVIHTLRTVSGSGRPVWLSECGIGSALDLVRLARHYERLGKTQCEDAVQYRRFLDAFLADWERWKMAEAFAGPEDYFRQCLAWMAGIRLLGTSAIRANPNVIGYSLTGTQDQGLTGEGLTTTFRELKPGTTDAMFEAFAPLRWCLFVEPVQVYRGGRVRFEAVLANEDQLRPDEYSARFQVFGPQNACLLDHTFYREVFSDHGWSGQDAPAEAVAGAINTSSGYSSGLTVCVHPLDAGRFVLTALRIRENLGKDPVAERLLRNMLRYAAQDLKRPPADLPAEFETQLKKMGYH